MDPDMQGVFILYDTTCMWERQFLLSEIFRFARSYEFENTHSAALTASKLPELSNIVLIFSSNTYSFADIECLAVKLQPAIIVHLSDEGEPGHRQAYNQLAKHCRQYLRQYNHAGYNYFSNTYLLPLGYGSGLIGTGELSSTIDVKPVVCRSLPWAFVGSLNEDRSLMIKTLHAIIPTGLSITNRIPIEQIRSLYMDSTFVPVGLGNTSLECFRIYEAVVLGAIPVIVGKPQKILSELPHIAKFVSILYADNWELAASAMSEALQSNQSGELQARQFQLIAAWNSTLEELSALIQRALY